MPHHRKRLARPTSFAAVLMSVLAAWLLAVILAQYARGDAATTWTLLAACALITVSGVLITADVHASTRHTAALRAELVQALTDPVTGLPVRRTAEDRIAGADPAAAMTAAVLDVNGMRAFNEAFGRSSGDLYLRAIADRLRTVAVDGLAVRLRDDEFAIISDRDPAELAQELIVALRAPANIDGRQRSIVVNIGVCQMDGANPNQLLGYAYLALLTARRHGLGVQYYDPARGSMPLLSPGTMPYTSAPEPLRPTGTDHAVLPHGVLACPRCGATELSTLERIPGVCTGTITRNGDGEVSIACGEYTDVVWDGQISVGVRCELCPWEYVGEDWAAQLAAGPTGESQQNSTGGDR